VDLKKTRSEGHFALDAGAGPMPALRYRKIEVKELPAHQQSSQDRASD
jgi:hypothetical protein